MGEEQYNILVVDNNIVVLQALRDSFIASGYNVTLAGDGKKGTDCFFEDGAKYNLVVAGADLSPEISGPAFFFSVRNKDKDVPFLMTSFGSSRRITDVDALKKLQAQNLSEFICGSEIASFVDEITCYVNQELRIVRGNRSEYSEERSALIVDDNIEYLKQLGKYLHEAGIHVYGARDAFSAFRHLRQNKIGVVVLDINLSGAQGAKEGLRMVSSIRNYYRFAEIVVNTGYEDVADYTRVERLVYDYLNKAKGFDAVLKSVNRAFEKRVSKLNELLMGRRSVPHIWVLCGPHGVGKTTFVKCILNMWPLSDVAVPDTSRQPREGEVSGRDKCFKPQPEISKSPEEYEFPPYTLDDTYWVGILKKGVMLDQLSNGKDFFITQTDPDNALRLQKRFHRLVRRIRLRAEPDEIDRRLRERGDNGINIDMITKEVQNFDLDTSDYFRIIKNPQVFLTSNIPFESYAFFGLENILVTVAADIVCERYIA